MTKEEAIRVISDIIVECTSDLSKLVLKGTVLSGTISEKINVYKYLSQIDNTIHTAAKKLNVAIDKSALGAYHNGIESAKRSLKRLTDLKLVPSTIHDDLHLTTLEYYVRNLHNKYSQLLQASSNTVKRIVVRYANGKLHEAVQKSILRHFVGTESVNPIIERYNVIVGRQRGIDVLAKELFKNFSEFLPEEYKDVVSGKMINIGGRNYNLAKYSELVAESTINEITVESEKNTYSENGVELVQIDIHNTKSEVCKPYEGTIWSITGESKRYKSIDECLNGGPPFHPRCQHYLLPVIDNETIDEKRTYRETKAVKKAKERLEKYIEQYPNGRTVNVYIQ